MKIYQIFQEIYGEIVIIERNKNSRKSLKNLISLFVSPPKNLVKDFKNLKEFLFYLQNKQETLIQDNQELKSTCLCQGPNNSLNYKDKISHIFVDIGFIK